jgi:hypothetical protein
MSFEPISSPPPAPPAPRPGRLGRVPRVAMAAGLAAGLGLGGAGIAFAASSSSTSTPGASTPSTTAPANGGKPGHGPRGFERGPGGFGRFGGFEGFGAGPVVHGQFTQRTPSGGYQTVEVQTGKVASVNATSIKVTSADGFSHIYTVSPSTVVDAQRDGIASVASGDQVQISATTVKGTDTAANIIDITKVGASRSGFGFGPGGRGGPPAAGSTAAGTTDD